MHQHQRDIHGISMCVCDGLVRSYGNDSIHQRFSALDYWGGQLPHLLLIIIRNCMCIIDMNSKWEQILAIGSKPALEINHWTHFQALEWWVRLMFPSRKHTILDWQNVITRPNHEIYVLKVPDDVSSFIHPFTSMQLNNVLG